MATISNADRRFLDQRIARRGAGVFVLPLVLVVVLAAWIGLFMWIPLWVNPFHAVGYFEGRPLEPGVVTTYAMVVSVLVDVLFLLLIGGVALAFLWARQERRYQKIYTELLKAQASETEASLPAPSIASAPSSTSAPVPGSGLAKPE